MALHRVKVLIIDEDAGFLEEVTAELSDHFTVYTSTTGANGLKMFVQLRPQVVIVDAGISDTPFAGLLEDLQGIDGAVLRIATSPDYSAMETVMQAIVTSHIHKYFRKPVNYLDLIGIINARTVSYQVDWSHPPGAGSGPAYEKLHTIMDKAKEVEKLRQQLEAQLAKIRDVEAECFIKVRDALEETQTLRKKAADKEALAGTLQTRILDMEELKKHDLERLEQERAVTRQEWKGLQDRYDQILLENSTLHPFKSDNEKLRREMEQQIKENGDLRVSVARERETMIEAMAQERSTLDEELARKKDEAERVVEVQKERNKAELQTLQDTHEEEKQRTVREIERRQAEFDADCKAKASEIEADRKRVEQELAEIEMDRQRVEQKLIEIEADRSRVEEELARKKDEAERSIAPQKERNKAELQALQDALKEEQQRAVWFEIDRIKTEIEKERQQKLAQIEADRRRMDQELAGMRARMAEEKTKLEKDVQQQRKRAEADIHRIRESAEEEQQRLTEALQASLAAMKKAAENEVEELRASATRELDRLKVTAQKKEQELSEALIQARRMAEEWGDQLKLTENRIKTLESEMEKQAKEKNLTLQELESMRADFKVAIQSREALMTEVTELRNQLG